MLKCPVSALLHASRRVDYLLCLSPESLSTGTSMCVYDAESTAGVDNQKRQRTNALVNAP